MQDIDTLHDAHAMMLYHIADNAHTSRLMAGMYDTLASRATLKNDDTTASGYYKLARIYREHADTLDALHKERADI